jgi:hypothetical protein
VKKTVSALKVSSIFFLAVMLPTLALAGNVGAKQVVGWVENIKVYPGGVTVKAKVDSGAKTSSLDCECITPFKRDGKDWLSFSVKNHKGDIIRLEKPVTRVAIIKRHFGKEQKRYVVKLGICLGSIYREAEVTLVDRTGFNYAMLVGRNFLKDDFLIDPSNTFRNQPECKGAPD